MKKIGLLGIVAAAIMVWSAAAYAGQCSCACRCRHQAPRPCESRMGCPRVSAEKSPSSFQQYADWFAGWPQTPAAVRSGSCGSCKSNN